VSREAAPGCEPEKVTALVDAALEPREAAALEAHLSICEACRAQADGERAVRQRLRGLPPAELPPGLETRLRARLERGRGGVSRLWAIALPVAATLLVALWARGFAPVVAWELARDHRHCYGFASLPAQVHSSDPAIVNGWFESRGTAMPRVPEQLGAPRLFGARYCRLADSSKVPHVYYTGGPRPLSVFVLTREARFPDGYTTRSGDRSVALLRVDGHAVGVVGESDADVETAVQRLRAYSATRQASLAGPYPPAR
jgi:hypothetical protein